MPPAGTPQRVRRFRLVAGDGPNKGKTWNSTADRLAIGSHPSNDVMIENGTVSRFHCEILVSEGSARVRDLGSKNGTILDGVSVTEAFLRHGSVLNLGSAALQFQLSNDTFAPPVSERGEFGSLVGHSLAMRTVFALLERAAASNATVLIEGETGTGKEGAAEALHLASPRKEKPLVVVDCGAIPANLLESELFGHEKGSFTGASAQRIGAFEEAAGGTIFLDEIGELPADLQPKLLRVLERKEIRRVGSNAMRPVDVRVVAATHRDLRAAVNDGRFRSDLYFRLAVVRVELPPLRARRDDMPLLVERLLRKLGAPPEAAARLREPEFLATLSQARWPGNVRELRNYLERCLVFEQPVPMGDAPDEEPGEVDARKTYAEARRAVLDRFERDYVTALLKLHGGNVAQAAPAAGVDRVYIYRLMRRHGLSTR
jgi:DNA-binding NtrC family response regulator